MNTLLDKKYSGESLYDATRDFGEAICEDYNEGLKSIPKDEYGFQKGTFRVVITWTLEE